jgi:hypothetical protein
MNMMQNINPFAQNMTQPQMNPYMQNPNPYMNRYAQPQAQPQMPQNNGIKWVQGREGAKAYYVAPNGNDLIMDSENEGIFYIKVSDSAGMCTLRTFSYTEITNQPNAQNIEQTSVDMSAYVTKAELEQILKNMKEIGDENGKQVIPANDTKPNDK